MLVVDVFGRAPVGRYAVNPNTPDTSKSDVRPSALLYERYVYHARGLDGATDIRVWTSRCFGSGCGAWARG